MPTFRVDLIYERVKTFYVEADSKEDVENFLDDNPEWDPSDVAGLVDSDESTEHEYRINQEPRITAGFRIDKNLELQEIDP